MVIAGGQKKREGRGKKGGAAPMARAFCVFVPHTAAPGLPPQSLAARWPGGAGWGGAWGGECACATRGRAGLLHALSARARKCGAGQNAGVRGERVPHRAVLARFFASPLLLSTLSPQCPPPSPPRPGRASLRRPPARRPGRQVQLEGDRWRGGAAARRPSLLWLAKFTRPPLFFLSSAHGSLSLSLSISPPPRSPPRQPDRHPAGRPGAAVCPLPRGRPPGPHGAS